MKKILLLLAMVGLFLLGTKNVLAAPGDLIVTPEKTPLFSKASDGFWMPGYFLTRTIYVKNNSADIKLVAITPYNFLDNPRVLSNKMEIVVADNFGHTLYGGAPQKFLVDFYTLVEYPLSFLLPSHDVTYSFTVSLDGPTTGNEYQNKTTGFDLDIGFYSETPNPTPTPTPENPPGPTNTPGPNATSTPGPNATPTPVPGTFITYEYGGGYVEVPVLGAETSVTPTPKKSLKEAIFGAGKKKGEALGACFNPWWWWLLYLLQIIFQIFIRLISRRENRKLVLFAEGVSGVLCAFIFWKFFCHWIFWVVSTLISLLFFYATHRKTKKEEEEE